MPGANLKVQGFYHEPSGTVTYLVADLATKKCAVIDPVANFTMATGKLDAAPLEAVLAEISAHDLTVEWILESHVHADHVTGAPALRDRVGGKIAIGAGIVEVQKVFAEIYGEGDDFTADGSQFDHLFAGKEIFNIGGLECQAHSTPGHTPACMSYHIGDAVFVGDTVFMPDFGTARCDFPGGDAAKLYASARHILGLPGETRIFVGHDYGPGGREIAWETNVATMRQDNKHVRDGISQSEFVDMRETRDAQLNLPGMIIPAIQINMRAGHLPPAGDNGVSYLKVPVNGFPGA